MQGFVVNHSVGGGTGSGLGALVLERCAVDYRKKSKLGFEVYPSPNLSTCIVEPYNALLSTHWLLDHTGMSYKKKTFTFFCFFIDFCHAFIISLSFFLVCVTYHKKITKQNKK